MCYGTKMGRISVWWLICVGVAPVHASPVEVLGLSSPRAGQANTGVAAALDGSAVYYNPANLVVRPGGELFAGGLATYAHLAAGDKAARLAHPFGLQLGARYRFHARIAVGLALHLLPRDLSTVRLRTPEESFYPYYGDRLSRAVALPGIAVRLARGLSVGLSANASTETVRGIAGASYQATPSLGFGVVYRQHFDVPYAVETRGRFLRGAAQFTPDQIAGGVAHRGDELVSTIDVTLARWSTYPGPFLRPDLPYRNTVAVRAGLESVVDEAGGAVYRVGYGYETSPIPEQQPHGTRLLDGGKHILSGGLGYAIPRRPIRIDAHVQIHVVSTRTTEDVKSGGEIVSSGMSVEVGF